MPLHVRLPKTGTLVRVTGPSPDAVEQFDDIAGLQGWTPTFEVYRVEIITTTAPQRAREEIYFTHRTDGTRVRADGGDNRVSITTPLGADNPVQAALSAYDWVFGNGNRK